MLDEDVHRLGRNNHPSFLLGPYVDLQHPVPRSHVPEDKSPFAIRIDHDAVLAPVVVVLVASVFGKNPRPLYRCPRLVNDAATDVDAGRPAYVLVALLIGRDMDLTCDDAFPEMWVEIEANLDRAVARWEMVQDKSLARAARLNKNRLCRICELNLALVENLPVGI